MPCLKTSLDSEAPMAGQRGEVLSRLGLFDGGFVVDWELWRLGGSTPANQLS